MRYLPHGNNLKRIRFIMHHGCANLCQCSSAWLEHSPCKRKVEGSKPSIGLTISYIIHARTCHIQPVPVCSVFISLQITHDMKFRRIKPKKLKVLTIMFFGTGGLGIGMGLYFGDFSMSSIGTSFICIGGFIGWMVLTGKHERDPRKKKK